MISEVPSALHSQDTAVLELGPIQAKGKAVHCY